MRQAWIAWNIAFLQTYYWEQRGVPKKPLKSPLLRHQSNNVFNWPSVNRCPKGSGRETSTVPSLYRRRSTSCVESICCAFTIWIGLIHCCQDNNPKSSLGVQIQICSTSLKSNNFMKNRHMKMIWIFPESAEWALTYIGYWHPNLIWDMFSHIII